MTDPAIRELLASYEAAMTVASRSLSIARTLAEGFRSGVRPPDEVLDTYRASVDRHEVKLAELREKLQQFKAARR